MESVIWSRLLTAETLAFHIIWATIGVGVPLFISIAEGIGIWKKDHHYILLARRWTRGFVITVAVGVVTGTCIGLMLTLLWPNFMQLAGNTISLPLFMETFAFFFEAIFLGIYLYTWDRFRNPIWHWLTSIPIVIGSAFSAIFITTLNSFMNSPTGFRYDLATGKFFDIDPIVAMLNPSTPSRVSHVLSSAYLTSGFLLAGLAAFFILRGRNHIYYQKALKLTMITGAILAILTALAGDISGKYLAKHQPEKLAAAEWHFETKKEAPLILGGTLNEETLEIENALEIPYALSILAGNSPDTEVKGLDQYARSMWPPLYIHYLFDTMIAIGMYLILVSILYLFFVWRKQQPARWMLWGIFLGAPLSFVAIEAGWIFAEVGRQPWIIVGIMRVDQAATLSNGVETMFYLFTCLYILLGIIASIVLFRLFRRNRAEEELEERYTPRESGGNA